MDCSKRSDEFECFNMNEHKIQHHYLNSEIEEDISFRHSDLHQNESNSLSRSGHIAQNPGYLSINSNQAS